MSLKVGIVVPHIFMQDDILPDVIFSPGQLAVDLANQLNTQNVDVTLFTPGPVKTHAHNITADLSYFEAELQLRSDSYLTLLKKHPLTFITLARQVQAELLAKAFRMANDDAFDIVHVYTNEEELGLVFQTFCKKPVVFTHHDPFNFLVQYRSNMPKYSASNWLAISESQKTEMPESTNWIKTIYHGLDENKWPEQTAKKENYIAYIGRIIEPKGVHTAIQAILRYNKANPSSPLTLKIAGKHYSGAKPGGYWEEQIEPFIDQRYIQYEGFIANIAAKQEFLAKAKALVVPSLFAEPFGMVSIEALACSTPVIGFDSGAIPEVVKSGTTGFIIQKEFIDDAAQHKVISDSTIQQLAHAFENIDTLDSTKCREAFLQRFTLKQMAQQHIEAYRQLLKND